MRGAGDSSTAVWRTSPTTPTTEISRLAESESLSDRILIGEVLLRHRLVDHEGDWCVGAVVGREVATGKERNAHGVEESVAREHDRRRRQLTVRSSRYARRKESNDLAIAAEGKIANRARCDHAGYRAHPVQHLTVGRAHVWRRRMTRRGDRVVHGQSMLGGEPEIDVQQLHETPRHQACSNDQNHRQRDFGDDERAPQSSARCRRTARAFAERMLKLRRRGANGRHEAEDDAGDDRDDRREHQHVPIDADIFSARQLTTSEPQQQARAQLSDEHAQRTTGDCQHHALGEELTHQS